MNTKDMRQGSTYTTYNIRTEVIVRVTVILLVLIIHLSVNPHKRHITETELLVYYHLPRVESIMPTWVTVILIISVPLMVLTAHSYVTGNYNDLTQSLLAWTLSLSITGFVTITGKLIVGRPRPDFYYRCFPDGEMSPDLQCSGTFKEEMEGRKSFPSGHSSFSFCSFGYISIWLLGELGVLSRNRGEGLRVITCSFPVVVAQLISFSRYCDNHHHWEDVFIGSMIGLAASYFCYLQYYYPLESEMSGQPYRSLSFDALFENKSEEECCTVRLNSNNRLCISLQNKKHK